MSDKCPECGCEVKIISDGLYEGFMIDYSSDRRFHGVGEPQCLRNQRDQKDAEIEWLRKENKNLIKQIMKLDSDAGWKAESVRVEHEAAKEGAE